MEMVLLTDHIKCKSTDAHKPGKCANKGHTSFHMQDPQLVFNSLRLKRGDTFLDLGCGAGDYSLYAAKTVGESGKVYSVDILQENIDRLCNAAAKLHLDNIFGKCGDMRDGLDFGDSSMDLCFLSTVLHVFDLTHCGERLFREVHRVLKREGRLAIIECKKEPMSFGPPLAMRLSPKELRTMIEPKGFKMLDYLDLGSNYMIQFQSIAIL